MVNPAGTAMAGTLARPTTQRGRRRGQVRLKPGLYVLAVLAASGFLIVEIYGFIP